MIHEVILPVLGETMNEGTIVEWHKGEGQPVSTGDVLYTLESDKTTLEVEAQTDGFLRRILVGAGQTVPVLTVVALISTSADEEVTTPVRPGRPEAAGQQAQGPGMPVAPAATASRVRQFASPRARRLAHQEGASLNGIRGSGPAGRIVERDVQVALATRRGTGAEWKATPLAQRAAADLHVDLASTPASGPDGRITLQDVQRAGSAQGIPEPLPLSRAQRLVAERMTTSFTTAPHFYLHADVDARQLAAVRASLLPRLESVAGVRLTYTDLLVRLCALVLARHPQVMAQWTPDGLRLAREVNIGVAVDTPSGLVVPVIRQANQLSLIEIARARTELAERARQGRLTPSDVDAGVFTLSNLGMFRIDFFDAILNPPQAAILAVGRIEERAMVENGQVIAALRVILSLSVDHRVLDGAAAARFLGELVEWIETPGLALG